MRIPAAHPGALVAVSQQATIAASAAAGWVDFPVPGAVASGRPVLAGLVECEHERARLLRQCRRSRPLRRCRLLGGREPAGELRAAAPPIAHYSIYATLGGATSAPANTALPTITGTPAGARLTASTGGWDGSPTGFAYQWQRCDAAAANCSPVGTDSAPTRWSPATRKTIRVVVTASNDIGPTPATSTQTGSCRAPRARPRTGYSRPSAARRPKAQPLFTAGNGAWSGSPTPTFTYQWPERGLQRHPLQRHRRRDQWNLRDPQGSDVGKTTPVKVTATNGSGGSAGTRPPTPLRSLRGRRPIRLRRRGSPAARSSRARRFPSPTMAPGGAAQPRRTPTSGSDATTPAQTASTSAARRTPRTRSSRATPGLRSGWSSTGTNGSGNSSATSDPTAVVIA